MKRIIIGSIIIFLYLSDTVLGVILGLGIDFSFGKIAALLFGGVLIYSGIIGRATKKGY